MAQIGPQVEYFDETLSKEAAEEVQWSFESLAAATSACALIVFYGGKCIAHVGVASGAGKYGAEAVMGPMCRMGPTGPRGAHGRPCSYR